MKDSSDSSGEIEQKKFSFDRSPAEHRAEIAADETSPAITEPIERAADVSGESEAVNEMSTAAATHNETRGCLPGGVLAAERNRRGFTVAEIASQLFLTERQISALEMDDYDYFPAPIFVTGYIRNYARLLDLPPDPLVELFNAQSEQAAPKLDRVTKTTGSVPDGSAKPFDMRIVAGAGAALILVLLLLWWMGADESEEAVIDGAAVNSESSLTSALPEIDVISDEVPVTVTVTPVEEARVNPQPVTPAKPIEPVKPTPTVVETKKEVVSAEPEAEFIADRAAAASFPDSIELTFTAESWVEITDANGRRVMFDLGKPGQRRALSGTAPFKVLFGYSPAVTVLYNGELFDQSRFVRGKVARFTLGANAE